jgi:2-methylaconitate cis-trans-isomerase PrpF
LEFYVQVAIESAFAGWAGDCGDFLEVAGPFAIRADTGASGRGPGDRPRVLESSHPT